MYKAKLTYRNHTVVRTGLTDHDAITAAERELQAAIDQPFNVELVVYYAYSNADHVLYCTTLAQYRRDTK